MRSFFFIQLFVIVIFTASFIPKLGGSFINKGLIGDFFEELARYQGGTTMALLAESMALKNNEQRVLFLAQQQALMPYNLSLKAVDSLQLPSDKMLALYENQLVYNADNHFLYMILAGHEQVLVLENVNISSEHIYSEAEREGMGLMLLLQRQLEGKDSRDWHSIIVSKSAVFSFDIALKPRGEFPLNQGQQKKLDQGKLVAISHDSMIKYGSGLNYLLQLTPDGKQVIVAGPIAPTITRLIKEYDLVNKSLSVILLLCLLCLWIWPTWRSSRELLVFIHQHAEFGKARKLVLRFGSHFNDLHNTFNQMSANITRQFSLNKMVTQYLSQRLEAPLLEMKEGLDKVEARAENRITAQEVYQQEKAINTIRHLSSDILLFSQVQGIDTLVNREVFDLENWLISKQDKLCETFSKLDLITVNQRREVYLDSKLMLLGLTQMLTVIGDETLKTLSMSVAVNQTCATLIIHCNSANERLEKDLTLLCDMSNHSGSKSTAMMTSGLNLPLFCCARIFQLHGGHLALQKHQDDTLVLEVIFNHANQLPQEVGR